MSKERKIKIIMISILTAFLLAFFVVLFLSLPLTAGGSVLPFVAFYIVGGITGGCYLLAGVILFLTTRRRS